MLFSIFLPTILIRSKAQELFASGGSRSGTKKEASPNLTKKTLDAIRQLFSSGQLSLAQKTKLIYSVVRSTKEEEVSEVRGVRNNK